MTVYREIVDSRMPSALDELSSVNPDIYESAARLLFTAFYEAIYHGLQDRNNGEILVPMNPKRRLTIKETETIVLSMAKHISMGYEIGLLARGNPHGIANIADAVEYVAERLGCTEYCGYAMDYLLRGSQKPAN